MNPCLASHPLITATANAFHNGDLGDRTHTQVLRKTAKQIKQDRPKKEQLLAQRRELQLRMTNINNAFGTAELEELVSVDATINKMNRADAEATGRMRRIYNALKGEVNIADLLRRIRTTKIPYISHFTIGDKPVNTNEEMIHAATQHFASHFQNNNSSSTTARQDFLQGFPSRVTVEANKMLCQPITAEEVIGQIKRMPAAKTPSIDGIPVEYYKSNSESLAPRLAHLYNNYINNGCLPPFLQTALLKIIPKPDKPVDKLDSYRPLSMLCNQYKILAGVLANRLKKLLPDIISPLQTGFVPGREMIDNALYMKLLFERHQIGEELGLALFLDFKSAFDMVNHDYLIDTLHAFGFGPWFIAAIKTLLNSHKARIELNDGLGPPFDWTRGVFQGCPIAPLLFIITLEPLIHRINQSGSKGIQVKGKEVRILAAADDTVILAQDEASLQDFLQILEQYQQASGAQLNLQKTIGANLLQRAPTQDFGVNWLDKTTNHKYLGFSINSTGFSPRNTFEEPIKKLEERLGSGLLLPLLSVAVYYLPRHSCIAFSGTARVFWTCHLASRKPWTKLFGTSSGATRFIVCARLTWFVAYKMVDGKPLIWTPSWTRNVQNGCSKCIEALAWYNIPGLA